MRNHLLCVFVALFLACSGLAQQPATKNPAEAGKSSNVSAEAKLKDMFESKVKAEWEALKKKDKNAYGELLAEDYQGVEADGRGERNKIQAINEVPNGNVYDYTLWGFKLISSDQDAAFLVYESTTQFPPKSVVRYSRVYIGELWVKRNGEWKELHYQETHVK
jgi:hypothetical protein